jgi:hypothetical protein
LGTEAVSVMVAGVFTTKEPPSVLVRARLGAAVRLDA